MIEHIVNSQSAPYEGRRLAKELVDYFSKYIADGEILHDLDIILTEACANVVRHAYGDDVGRLEVRTRVEPGAWIEIEIVDWGGGFGEDVRFENPGPDSEGGRGMFIISMLVDVCEVRESEGENIMFIHKDIGKHKWKN